jgi:ribose-phosphate pyrophosphokinase
LIEAAAAIIKNGATEVHACCAHAVLSGPSVERVTDSKLKSLMVTDTIPLSEKARVCDKIKVLTISELIGEAIIRSYKGDSVTSLFV